MMELIMTDTSRDSQRQGPPMGVAYMTKKASQILASTATTFDCLL
jgi:hypothetical protein